MQIFLTLIILMGSKPIYSKELAYDAGTPEKVELPNETYLTIGIALMASSLSFSGCLKPIRARKAPVLAFVGGASYFLFREVTIKEEYDKASKELLQIVKWKNREQADKQIELYEKAAAQESLAAQAAEKKASNAKFLQRALYISAGLFAVFPLQKCMGCGPGYWGCVPLYNSCRREICLGEMSPLPKNLFEIFSIPSAHALAFNAEKLGIASLGLILGKANILGRRLSSIPDIGKSAMLTGLAVAAGNATKKWEVAAKKYRKNEQSYLHLAKAVKTAIETNQEVVLNQNIKPLQYAPNPFTSEDKQNSSQTSPCAVGNLGELTIDRNCQCKKTGTCAKDFLPKINFADLNAPSGFSEAYGSFNDELNSSFQGDSFSSGDFATETSRLSAGGGIQDWPKKLFDKMKKNIDGKKARELHILQSDAQKKFHKAVTGTYKAMSPQEKNAFHNAVGSFSSGTDSPLSPLPQDTQTSQTKAVTTPPHSQDISSSSEALNSFFGDDSSTPPPNKEKVLEKYSIPNSALINKADLSLWGVITLRYFITAYPRLFEEK